MKASRSTPALESEAVEISGVMNHNAHYAMTIKSGFDEPDVKASNALQRDLTSIPLKIFGMNWNIDCVTMPSCLEAKQHSI